MSGAGKRILLGRIVGAHGIRGDVQIAAYTGAPDAIGAYGPLSNEAGNRTFAVRVVRVTPKGVIARVDGVTDRTAAEKLKGTDLYVTRDRLPPPGEGEFYHEDLIGLAAVDPDGKTFGILVAVSNFGAGDLIEIKIEGQRHTELIPFTSAFVPSVDVAGGRVTVVVPASTEGDESDETPGD